MLSPPRRFASKRRYLKRSFAAAALSLSPSSRILVFNAKKENNSITALNRVSHEDSRLGISHLLRLRLRWRWHRRRQVNCAAAPAQNGIETEKEKMRKK